MLEKLILLLPIFSTYFILPVDSYEVSPDCSNTQCNYGKGCVIRNNKPICVPINKENNCEKTQCGAGEECMYEEVVCIRAPCYPIPKCVGGGPEETPHETEPEVISSYGQPIKAEARIAAETITVRINKPKDPETKGHPTLSCANVLCAIETPRCIETPAGPKCVAVKNCDQVKCGYNKKCVHDNLAQDATCVPVKKTDPSTTSRLTTCTELTCSEKEKCVQDNPKENAKCEPVATCELIDCASGHRCVQGGPHEDAQCIPLTTCAVILCLTNSRCIESNGVDDARCEPLKPCTKLCIRGYRCVNGNCVSTCQVVKCGAGQRCEDGDEGAKCVSAKKCADITCGKGETCIESNGVDDARCEPFKPCIELCIRGYRCVNGKCVSTCQAVKCGAGQSCQESVNGDGAQCLPVNDCSSIKCKPGYNCMIDPSTNNAACVLRYGNPSSGKTLVLKSKQSAVTDDCPVNEVPSDCVSSCEPTCENQSPEACIEVCDPNKKCTCTTGFVRGPDGKCVDPSTCSIECGTNETLNNCGNLCEGKCSQIGDDSIACIEICAPPACACKDGFYRNNEGKCVNKDDCGYSSDLSTTTKVKSTVSAQSDSALTIRNKSAVKQKVGTGSTYGCSSNETLSGCGNICEGKCEQVGKGPVACPEICLPPACACKEGFYRQATGECVDIRDCTLTCGPNEEGNPCGNLCEPTCQNAISNEPVICPAICGPPACVCQPNFYRKNKVCVPKSQCLDSCGKNEQINRCGSRCEETCENAFGLIKPCPHICDPPACVCKPNFYRKDGKCVPRDQCTLKCEEGEILAECGNICEPKCKDIGKPPRPCVLICAPRACTCVNGLYRDNKGKCVSKDKCSSATPPNQGYQAKIGLASLKAVVQPNPCGRS